MDPLSYEVIAFAIALVIATVIIHSMGTYVMVRASLKYIHKITGHVRFVWLTFGVTVRVVMLLSLHILEILLWASLYFVEGCFPDFRTSFYFSLTTYVTVGYGDVVLPGEFKMLGGIEGLIGVMMLSWSTALLVGYLQRVYAPAIERARGDHHSE